MLFWNASDAIQEQLLASKRTVFLEQEWWRIFISPFFHSDGKHLLSNLSMLTVMSYLIYGFYGMRPLLVLMVPLAALIHLLTLYYYPLDVRLLGISGVVYATCGYWVALYLGIDRRRTWLKRILRALGFSALILLPTTFEESTSYSAHGVGFLIGVAYGCYHFAVGRSYFRKFEEWQVEEDEFHPHEFN